MNDNYQLKYVNPHETSNMLCSLLRAVLLSSDFEVDDYFLPVDGILKTPL